MILDRFYWNVWPRQTVCTDGCGNDFFCQMDEDPGCLKEGPWSVKVFDAIARISSRLIISTTNLMFSTMCHGSWNYLSEVDALRPFLYGWRADNYWLHALGGWSIGVWTLLHVWSLLLPSMFHGYTNEKVPGVFTWLPPQVASGSNIDSELKLARWGDDDIWRIFWMTLMFGLLLPVSRSAWALTKNFSFCMVLHTALGAGYYIDSVRRKTHPHVWILNTPVVIWYIIDKVWCATKGRVGELAHPFTTCSSHDVTVEEKPRNSTARHGTVAQKRPMIEVPLQTDTAWPGHRFALNSAISHRSLDLGTSINAPKLSKQLSNLSFASSFRNLSGTDIFRSGTRGARGLVQGHSFIEEGKFGDWEEEETMIGADTGAFPGEVSFVVGSVSSFDMSISAPRPETPQTDTGVTRGRGDDKDGARGKAGEKKMGLKRLETQEFREYREKEAREGGGGVGAGWNKMAIIRIHRPDKKPEPKECSCLGITQVVSCFRKSETSSIADYEIGKDGGGGIPLCTYGPYRSDYGRLTEFPNLPPLLIIATGAGAALALDFVAYVRANQLQSKRPVKVCYSSASLALLQFVTNTLLAESTPGIHIKTALTRHDDLEVFDTKAGAKDDLAIGRLNVKSIVDEVSDDTEVYFCGGGAINVLLRKECDRRKMKFTGSAVQ
eukprot:jgi/Undpi1/4410/HiC_scaffold_17.g07765.m1